MLLLRTASDLISAEKDIFKVIIRRVGVDPGQQMQFERELVLE